MSKLNKIIENLKTNPIEINHNEIFYKGKQPFKLEIIIKKLHERCDKPTHKTIQGLVRSMKKAGGRWLRADDHSNRPQLHGFMQDYSENTKYFTIDAKILHKEKFKPNKVIELVNPKLKCQNQGEKIKQITPKKH